MDRLLTHDEVQELLGAYAVHAMEPAEFEQVEQHLATCAQCTDEVERLLEASAALGMTELAAPTVDLWDRIRTEVVPNEPGADSGVADPGVADPGVAQVIRLDAAREHRREKTSRWRLAVASAAAAVAVAVPVTSLVVGSSAPSLAALAESAADQTGTRTVSLKGPDGTQLAEAVLTASGQGYVREATLPELPDGQTYQLWFIDGDAPVSSGLLGRSPKISAFSARADIDAIAISVEPSAGSTAPSSTPVAVGALA
jgi:Anti-sigma-K factor rskA/Putative zinc-finger